MHGRRGIACLLLLCAAVLAACQGSGRYGRTPVAPHDGGVCENLAYVFGLVAFYKERGTPREDQIEALQHSVQNPFAAQPEATLASLVRVVDLVYAAPETEARTLQTRVRDNCVVDEQGRAVLRTLEPTPEP